MLHGEHYITESSKLDAVRRPFLVWPDKMVALDSIRYACALLIH
jgi:hypothetical protein